MLTSKRPRTRLRRLFRCAITVLFCFDVPLDAADQVVLRISDYAVMPMTGIAEGVGNDGSIARVNFMREEPGRTGRFRKPETLAATHELVIDRRSYCTFCS